MPRPNRAQGRPGTQVIPADWGTSHAPVVRKTCTATIRIFPPATDGAEPVLGADYTVQNPAAAAAIYDGTARIQALNGQEAATLTGDQNQITAGYMVVIDRDAAPIPVNAIVQVTGSDDPTLIGGRRLIVRKIARGSIRWERDLWCVDDITRTS